MCLHFFFFCFFFFNAPATTEIYTLSLHDALPICGGGGAKGVLQSCEDNLLCILVSQKTQPLRSEEHTSELQSLTNLVCRLLLEKKKINRLLVTPRLNINNLTHENDHISHPF